MGMIDKFREYLCTLLGNICCFVYREQYYRYYYEIGMTSALFLSTQTHSFEGDGVKFGNSV